MSEKNMFFVTSLPEATGSFVWNTPAALAAYMNALDDIERAALHDAMSDVIHTFLPAVMMAVAVQNPQSALSLVEECLRRLVAECQARFDPQPAK